MSDYQIKERYRDDEYLREAYFAFISQVFPRANFRSWFERGCWSDEYNPVSIVVDAQIVSNVSLSRMNLLLNGRPVRGIQLGAVGTIPAWRGKGLSRLLMNHIIERYAGETDVMFLFGNDDVVEFYPKFGFTEYREAVFVRERAIPRSRFNARQLDIHNQDDWKFILDKMAQRTPISRLFGAVEYDFVTTWHLINLHANHIYHVERPDVIAIVSERDGVAHVWDVIFSGVFDPEELLPLVIRGDDVREVCYYFTPDVVPFEYDRTGGIGDSHLFVRGEFPIAGREFKFPGTAET